MSEKYATQLPYASPPVTQKSNPWIKAARVSVIAALLLYLALDFFPLPSFRSRDNLLSKAHYRLKGKKLPYVPQKCEGTIADNERFDCGYFEVPLNYLDPKDTRKAQIAFSRFSPDIPQKEKLGTVFVNPGGPGGSGYDFNARAGAATSYLQGGKYDVIGFDPRGIGRTHPKYVCFNSSTTESISSLNLRPYTSVYPHGNLTAQSDIDELERQLAAYDAMDVARAGSCLDPEGAREYMSTATVVRDIERMASMLTGPDTPINYQGFSYGTILGTYLISMFPQRLGRIVIDGVADADRWWSIPHHEMAAPYNLGAMEIAYEEFLSQCAKAGQERCALAYEGATLDDLKTKMDTFLEALYWKPLPVPHASVPSILTVNSVRLRLLAGGYKPRTWGQLAEELQAAIEGDGKPIIEQQISQIELDSKKHATGQGDAGAMVSFTDAPVFKVKEEKKIPIILDQIMHDHQKYTNHFAGVILGGLFNPGWNWNTSTVERFTGPIASNLNYPMLIIGNTFDNICPYHNAVRIHSFIKDSYLIEQNTAGHCSNAVTSLCTVKIQQDYFTHGILPKNDVTFCESDEELFPAKGMSSSGLRENPVHQALEEVERARMESVLI